MSAEERISSVRKKTRKRSEAAREALLASSPRIGAVYPLRAPAEETSQEPRSTAPARQDSGARGQFLTVFICAAALIATMAVILLLNIRISNGQYELTRLQGEERSLTQQNESLTQDLEYYNAPQNLAIMANDLGMVPSTQHGTVNLTEGKVQGNPSPAADSKDHDVLVDPPKQNGSKVAEEAQKRAQEREAQRAREAREEEKKKSEGNFNGGTLEAPQQRSPGE